MIKKALKLAGIGFLLGVSVNTFIIIISFDGQSFSPVLTEALSSVKAAMLAEEVLSGVYGAVCMGSTVIYEADRLPLAAASLLHCAICIIPFFPLSLLLGWSSGAGDTLIMTGCQLAAYFMIWLILYLKYRNEIKKLNEIQQQVLNDKKTGGQQ